MKKFIFTLIVFALTSTLNAKHLQELVVTSNPPMSCQNCEQKIKNKIRFEKGIKKIITSIPDQQITIEYDADKTDPKQIEAAFEKIGYKIKILPSQNKDQKFGH